MFQILLPRLFIDICRGCIAVCTLCVENMALRYISTKLSAPSGVDSSESGHHTHYDLRISLAFSYICLIALDRSCWSSLTFKVSSFKADLLNKTVVRLDLARTSVSPVLSPNDLHIASYCPILYDGSQK